MIGWLLAHLSGGHARQHPLRAIVQVIAIAVGVALGYAVNLINASALDEFSGAVRHVLGQSDFTISGGRIGFDEQLYARMAALPEVEMASPIVEVEAPVPSQPTSAAGLATLRIVGVDVFRAALLSPALSRRARRQSRAARSGCSATACSSRPPHSQRFGVRAGRHLCACRSGRGREAFRIAGAPAARARRRGTGACWTSVPRSRGSTRSAACTASTSRSLQA